MSYYTRTSSTDKLSEIERKCERAREREITGILQMIITFVIASIIIGYRTSPTNTTCKKRECVFQINAHLHKPSSLLANQASLVQTFIHN